MAHIAELLNSSSLSTRRTIRGLMFLYKMLNSRNDYPEPFLLVCLRTDHRTRHGSDMAGEVDFLFAEYAGRRSIINIVVVIDEWTFEE
ncbi:hypothetical protein J6590_100594 [Homalodisca vitripennis]|nr:hypothetical protein J6590_100594 [Homalodisca vitripennis]